VGIWTSHRQRQAGRYAKASYRLQRAEARNAAAMRRVELAWTAHLVASRRRELGLDVPARPDRELPS
jgi:hypothetical protein